ncbi:MAG: hypothetical protein Q9210_002990 [Variospora velana]
MALLPHHHLAAPMRHACTRFPHHTPTDKQAPIRKTAEDLIGLKEATGRLRLHRDRRVAQELFWFTDVSCWIAAPSAWIYPDDDDVALLRYTEHGVVMAINSSTQHGKRLIPQILDNLASAEPDRIIYSVASFSDLSHAFRHISARTFAMAVDKTAWWLRNQVGKPTSIQAVGYIGPRRWKENDQA